MSPLMTRFVAARANIEACKRLLEFAQKSGDRPAIADAYGSLHHAREYAERVCREFPDGTYVLTQDIVVGSTMLSEDASKSIWRKGESVLLRTHENVSGADVRELRHDGQSVLDIREEVELFARIFVLLEERVMDGMPSDYSTNAQNVLDKLVKMRALKEETVVFAIAECERDYQAKLRS